MSFKIYELFSACYIPISVKPRSTIWGSVLIWRTSEEFMPYCSSNCLFILLNSENPCLIKMKGSGNRVEESVVLIKFKDLSML